MRGRHGLHRGFVRRLLRPRGGLPIFRHQRGSLCEIQRRRRQDTARLGRSWKRNGLWLWVRRLSAVLPARDLPVGTARRVHVAIGYPSCVRRRGGDLLSGECHRVLLIGPTRRMRIFGRTLLSTLKPRSPPAHRAPTSRAPTSQIGTRFRCRRIAEAPRTDKAFLRSRLALVLLRSPI